jgi:hypothetical protein
MHASATCKIVFSASMDSLEAAMDYLDRIQRGDYSIDDETENLVLIIEEDLYLSNKEDIIAFIDRLYKKFKKKIDIHAIGTLTAIGSDAHQRFECQCNKNFFRYRETEWSADYVLDEDLSYEEFEEENYVDIDEDEYEEKILRAHEGIGDDSDDIYGDWDYID